MSDRPSHKGSSRAHDSAERHVDGSAVYIDDSTRYRDQLHVAIGGSQIASGEVTALDLSGVYSSPGVVDVLTESDLPALKDIGPVFPGDPLLSGTIEFFGQAMFAVAASSHTLARQGVEKASVTYHEREPLLDIEAAIASKSWVRPPHTMHRGDVESAYDHAPRKLSGQIALGGQDHFYLEGQAALAVPEEHGGVTVYSSNQNPTEAQKIIAEVLGVPMQQVTVVTRRMGGGFGGKETQAAACACFAALFAQRRGCPVSCRLSRRDDMVMTGKRHPFLNTYRTGFDERGSIISMDYQLAGQCGNSPDLSDAIVDRAMFHCDNAYYLPAVSIEGLRCKSNTVSNTAFRGFGGPQGMITMETVIDEIAYATGLDPLDVRKRNFYGTDDRNLTPYHQVVTDFNVPLLVDELEKSSDYRQRKIRAREFNAGSPVLKRGIALTPVKFGISFTVSHLNQAGALLHLYTDGSFHLNHGGTEMGQGLMIKVAQIVAGEFDVDPAVVGVSATRTDKVPNTSATAASSGTDLNGMAAWEAARTIKRRLTEHLLDITDCTEPDIVFKAGRVQAGNLSMSLAELAHSAWMHRVQLSATGFYQTPEIYYDRESSSGNPFYYYATGAAVSEVVLDTLTGENRLLRVDILHDAGNSINPAVDIGQIEGGFIQGLGWLTTEELAWDASGKLLTDGPANYKIPAISDCPATFNVTLMNDTPNAKPTIMRSKAVGEPPLMLAISAHCALRDAIGSLADYKIFPVLNAPATPEEILRSIDQLREGLPA